MVKFSVGEEDGEGPSNRVPKKRKISFRHASRAESCILREPRIVVAQEEEPEAEVEEDESEEDEESEEEEDDEEEDLEAQIQASSSRVALSARDAGSSEGSISVTLTDPEVLDCSICWEPLTIPVFQCENGHVACSACCTKLMNRCPSCCSSIGYNRCRALEKVLESIKLSCQNRKYGCRESFIYSMRHKHEKECSYTPCSCPFSGCSFVHSWKELSLHMSCRHHSVLRLFKYNRSINFRLDANERFIIFQEECERSLFILDNRKESLGNIVSVSRIGPPKGSYHYELVAKIFKSSLRLQCFTNNVQKWDDRLPSDSFLLIPSQFFNPSELHRMELCISSYGEFPFELANPVIIV